MKMKQISVTSLNSIPEALNEFEGLKSTSCEGYLYLQSPGIWGLPTPLWKRKYCILRDDCVYMTKKYGDLIIPDVTSNIQIQSDTGIYPDEHYRGKYKYCIRITQEKQTYILCSKTENERNKWLNSLLTLITKKYIINFKSCAYETIRLPSKIKRKSILSRRHSSFEEQAKDEVDAKDARFRLYSDGAINNTKLHKQLKPLSCKQQITSKITNKTLKKIEEANEENVKKNDKRKQRPKSESFSFENTKKYIENESEKEISKTDRFSTKRRGSYSFALFKAESLFDLNLKTNDMITTHFYAEL